MFLIKLPHQTVVERGFEKSLKKKIKSNGTNLIFLHQMNVENTMNRADD